MSSVSQTSPGATQRSAREPLTWKSSSDVVIAGILMVLTAPLIFAAWVLVRLTSRGPGFYSQIRLGLGGRHFRIYKLRSMTHDCERETGPRWSTRGDSRVTPFGRFLRSTHIDELPQLLNILRGDMSLVGPRPEPRDRRTTRTRVTVLSRAASNSSRSNRTGPGPATSRH